MIQHGRTSKTIRKWKKPDAKDHLVHDAIHMKCPEKATLGKQKAGQRLPGLGQDEDQPHVGMKGLWGDRHVVLKLYGAQLCGFTKSH